MQRAWRRTSPLTRTLGMVVVVALAATAIWWFGIRDASAATTAPITRTVAASTTTMEKSVSGSGTLAPTVQQDVNFAVSGTVTAVPVAVGETVTAGQTLATVDTLKRRRTSCRRSRRWRAHRPSCRRQDGRHRDDGERGQIAAAQAQVDVAQTGVDTAQTAMNGATLVAPVGGLLTAVDLEVGDAVSGSSPRRRGRTRQQRVEPQQHEHTTAQFTIVDTANWKVDVTVSDADVALITVGDQADVTLDGATTPIFGTISAIGLLSTSTRAWRPTR